MASTMFCTARKVLGPAEQPKSTTEIEFKGAKWRKRFRRRGRLFLEWRLRDFFYLYFSKYLAQLGQQSFK